MNLNDQTADNAHNTLYEQQEQELIQRCRQGDHPAFQQMILRYQDQVFTYIAQSLSDPAQARAITRQVFVRAYKTFPQFRGAISLKAWFLALAERQVLHAKRQKAAWYQRLRPQRKSAAERAPQAEKPEGASQDDAACQAISELLSPYLDGELNEPDPQRVAHHLQICPRCQQEFDELQETLNLVQSYGILQAPPELRVEIMGELARMHSLREKLAAWLPTAGIRAAAAVAGLVILLLGSLVVTQQQQITLLHDQLQQQGTVRGPDAPQTPTDEAVTTFLIFTGKLVSHELPLAAGELLEQFAPDPDQVQTRFLPGDLPTLEQQVQARVQQIPGAIVEVGRIQHDKLLVRQIVVDAPATAGALLARLLDDLSDRATSPDARPPLPTTRLKIYLVDQKPLSEQ